MRVCWGARAPAWVEYASVASADKASDRALMMKSTPIGDTGERPFVVCVRGPSLAPGAAGTAKGGRHAGPAPEPLAHRMRPRPYGHRLEAERGEPA
jgi:hypothetical protein